MLSKLISIFFIFLFFIISPFSFADGIGLNKSRIIFEAKDKNQVVEINNESNNPYLIQASILSSLDETVSNKFLITPPLFRIDANSTYSVRVVPSNIAELPKDRESIFYFKVRAIPPSKQANDDEKKADLVFITAIIIKMHYRPDNFPTPGKDIFNKINLAKIDGKWQMNNPTPYYLTVIDLSLNNESQNGSLLIPPFSKSEINTDLSQLNQASWRFIDDFGAYTDKYQMMNKEREKELNEIMTKQ